MDDFSKTAFFEIRQNRQRPIIRSGLPPRTVYRDLDALQAAGFPIFNERVNGTGFWALLASARKPVPVPFSLSELMALYFSRDAIKALRETVFYDSLESLFKKIKATLPADTEKYLK